MDLSKEERLCPEYKGARPMWNVTGVKHFRQALDCREDDQRVIVGIVGVGRKKNRYREDFRRGNGKNVDVGRKKTGPRTAARTVHEEILEV